MISVILPTVRPAQARACLNTVRATCELEIVVVADFPKTQLDGLGWTVSMDQDRSDVVFEGEDRKLVWLERPRGGVVDALNAGYAVARGDYLFTLSDEAFLEPRCIDLLYLALQDEPDRVLTPQSVPDFPFRYYEREFAPFPFLSRKTLTYINRLFTPFAAYFFDPCYHSFYADPDLSLKAHRADISVATVPHAIIRHYNDLVCPAHLRNLQHRTDDCTTFQTRWNYLREFREPHA